MVHPNNQPEDSQDDGHAVPLMPPRLGSLEALGIQYDELRMDLNAVSVKHMDDQQHLLTSDWTA